MGLPADGRVGRLACTSVDGGGGDQVGVGLSLSNAEFPVGALLLLPQRFRLG